MIVDVAIALSTAAQDVVLTARRWDEDRDGPYSGPLTRRQQRLFDYMHDETARRRLFSTPTLQGTEYNLWLVTFDDSKDTLQAVRDEIEGLMAEYPNQIAVLGAWHFEDGAQVGTRNGGDPIYPIPNFFWRFMPERIGATSNADLQDINLLYGQSPRQFA